MLSFLSVASIAILLAIVIIETRKKVGKKSRRNLHNLKF